MQPQTPEAPRSPRILSWEPAAEEEELATPCGSEEVRGVVTPSTIRMRPGLSTSKDVGMTACRQTGVLPAEASEIQEMLKLQSAALMEHMEALMLRQERVITSLMKDRSRENVLHDDSLVQEPWPLLEGQATRLKVDGDQSMELAKPAIHKKNSRTTSSIPGSKNLNAHFISRTYEKSTLRHRSTACETFLKTLWHQKTIDKHRGIDVSESRKFLGKLLNSPIYDAVMAMFIIFNSVLVVAETDSNAACNGQDNGCAADWIFSTNLVLLVIYTIETVVVIFVYRWNVIDKTSRLFEIIIVIAGYIDILVLELFEKKFPNIQILKLIRLSRLLRAMRLFNFFPELRFIMNGFICAMCAMLWGFCLLMLILISTAVVAVELIHPVNREVQHDNLYCSEAFDSVWNATIMFFQTIAAGDSWGECTIPIMKFQPSTFLLFGGSVVSVQVGFLNLIMSVVLTRVSDARQADTAQRLQEKEREIESSRQKWLALFDSLDTNGDGELSVGEIVNGFENLPDFGDDLRLLGIEMHDLPILLGLMDKDNNKQVSVDELMSTFDMIWHFDNKMHQVTMSMQLRVIAQRMERRLMRLEKEINLCVQSLSVSRVVD